MHHSRLLLSTLCLAAGSALLSGCESAQSTVTWQDNGMPRHEHPQQDWWHYQFVYHPFAHAYYEPYSATWFWFENGSWWYGEELPRGLNVNAEHAVVVKTRWDLPFLQHQPTTLAMHPCPIDVPMRFDPQSSDPFVEQIVSFPVFAPDGVE